MCISNQSNISNQNKPKEHFLYLFVVNVNKFGGSFNTVDDPYTQGRAPDKAKEMNVKVFNLILSVNKQNVQLQYECKELDCWIFIKDDYVWSPSTCDKAM